MKKFIFKGKRIDNGEIVEGSNCTFDIGPSYGAFIITTDDVVNVDPMSVEKVEVEV